MRRIFSLFVTYSLVATIAPAADNPQAPVESVCFGEQELELAWEIKSASNNMKEFIPKGQTLRSWTTFVGVYEYPLIGDPRAFALQMAESVKHQNPRAQSAMSYNAKTGVSIIDFVTWPVDAKFVEYNVFRFERHPSKGIIGYQYAVRDYKDKKTFFKNLEALRKQSIKTMMEEGVITQPAATDRIAELNSAGTSQR
jgi:hypothetical protein